MTQVGATTLAQFDSEHFSPYRADGKLYGFVCVVTAATQPIGRAIVNELAAHGAACIYACTSPSSPPYSQLPHPTHSHHPNTKIIDYPYQPASEQDTLALIDDVLNAWGRLDIWTTSTSTSINPLTTRADPTPPGPSQLLAAFEQNAMPAFLALKYAPSAMQKTSARGNYANAAPKDVPYGSIVLVTRGTGVYGARDSLAFTMTSRAALGVVEGGVGVLRGTGVRMNAVVVGRIDGDGDDDDGGVGNGLERVGRPEEIGRVVGFLASGFSSYVTGAEVRVDGGAGFGSKS